MLNLAAATASIVDADLNRKNRDVAYEWRTNDLNFRNERLEESQKWYE